MDKFCQNCGHELKGGEAFCSNCGTTVNNNVTEPIPTEVTPVANNQENNLNNQPVNNNVTTNVMSPTINNQDVKPKSHNGYKITIGIILIFLGLCLTAASSVDAVEVTNPVLVYTIPGILGIAAGILNICSKKNNKLLLPAAICMFIGAIVNFAGIIDISLYAIACIVFGIINLVYTKK